MTENDEKLDKIFNPWKDGNDGFSITLSKNELLHTMEEHNMNKGQLVSFVMGSIMESLAPMIDNMVMEEEKRLKNDSCDW